MTGWTPLFQRIVCSSLWDQEDHVRIAWVTMLALSTKEGEVPIKSAAGLARMAKISVEKAEDAIRVLSSPDPTAPPDDSENGRRVIQSLNGWRIVKWAEYRELAKASMNRERNAGYQAAHRERQKEAEDTSDPKPRFTKPTIEELRLLMAKSGMPESEAENFLNYYEANGWKVGRNPMRSVPHAVGNWKRIYDERRHTAGSNRPNTRASVIAERNSTISGVSEVQRRLLERDAEEAERRKQGIMVNPFAPKP